MTAWHLDDLRNQLYGKKWRVIAQLEGNNYEISGVWELARPDGSCQLHIEFEGLDDMETLPVDRSYGCSVRESPDCSLYFRKKGELWKQELAEFVDRLGRISS